MKSFNRREVMKLSSAAALASFSSAASGQQAASAHTSVAVWQVFEATLRGPSSGNPFVDTELKAVFSLGHRSVEVRGFYDGEGTYRVRFMPDTEGAWAYRTTSNRKELDGQQESFTVTPALPGSHGPVRVHNTHHFASADGAPFFPFGTTCYAWTHQSETLQRQTLESLRSAPFNKLRMCVFPKHYEYNHNEPPFYPFERTAAGVSDFTRPNPAFFAHLEKRIADLRALDIQADLILFHPYDRWGFSAMPAEADDRYLRYVLARLSAYPNIWWSMANEFDLMKAKTTADFDRLFHIVEQEDPYGHLRSIHYSKVEYDYARPWVTHASLQTHAFGDAPAMIDRLRKPILFDEVMYEGNLNRRWGNISGAELAHRFWLGVIAGCYVTHGETLLDPADAFDEDTTPTLWWSHGGKLRGSSPARIGFLRKLVEATVSPGNPLRTGLAGELSPYYLNATAYGDGKRAQTILYYFDEHQPVWYEFPLPEGKFTAEAIDPIAMTIESLPGTFSGKAKIRLKGIPYQALRFRAV